MITPLSQHTSFFPHCLAQSDCLTAERQGQGDTRLTLTPSVIPNSNYVIMVGDWSRLKYFCVFLYCNQQVPRDFLITLYIHNGAKLFDPSCSTVNIERQVTVAQFCMWRRDQILINILSEAMKRKYVAQLVTCPGKGWNANVIVIRGRGILSSVKLYEVFRHPSIS
jgi:hypothetical protein